MSDSMLVQFGNGLSVLRVKRGPERTLVFFETRRNYTYTLDLTEEERVKLIRLLEGEE